MDLKYRASKHHYYLNIAKAVAGRSTCLRRHYGAVIVKDDEIIATGYNGSPRWTRNCSEIFEKCPRKVNTEIPHSGGDYIDCRSVHAEQNAIISAARRDMMGGTLYLACIIPETGEEREEPPTRCPICLRMVLNAGITKVVSRSRSGLVSIKTDDRMKGEFENGG